MSEGTAQRERDCEFEGRLGRFFRYFDQLRLLPRDDPLEPEKSSTISKGVQM